MQKGNILLCILTAAVLVGGYALARAGILTPAAGARLAATYNAIPTASGKELFKEQSKNLTRNVDPILVDLDSQIITCNPNVDNVLARNSVAGGSCVAGETSLGVITGMYLGGQCCGSLKDLSEYNGELENLQRYKDIPDVPMNPYKTPISLAKKWIDYDHATTLAPQERVIMDEAMGLSKEGPCCCACWHYYVNEGIAKKMITDDHYTAAQVAAYWDTSSIC